MVELFCNLHLSGREMRKNEENRGLFMLTNRVKAWSYRNQNANQTYSLSGIKLQKCKKTSLS